MNVNGSISTLCQSQTCLQDVIFRSLCYLCFFYVICVIFVIYVIFVIFQSFFHALFPKFVGW